MSHPHAMSPHDHREKARDMVERTGNAPMPGKRRHGFKHGGAIHEDEAEDAEMISKGVHDHEGALHPGKPKTKLKFKSGGSIEGHEAKGHLGKRARGGSAGKKATHVNVIVAPQGGGGGMGAPGMMPAAQPAMPPRPAAPPPQAMAPRPPMAAAPPGGGMPPGGMPGGAMMPRQPGMKRGGRLDAEGDAAEFERKRAESGAGGARKVVEAGTPWKNILHSKRGGKIPRRDLGGPATAPMPPATAGMPGQPQPGQPTPQQQQAAQQMMQQRAAQARMTPAAGVPGMLTQKRGGRTERAEGGWVPHMEAGAGSGEGRIEKVREYGEGRGFKPKEHKGEFLKRAMVS